MLWPKNHLLLTGPAYSGKSHLACIWAERNDAILIQNLADIESVDRNFVIDSVENIHDEYNLIELFRLADYLNIKALWVSNRSYFEFDLSDLMTRFASMIRLTIEQPSESLFKSILRKRCTDFGLNITDESLEYITKRAEITYDVIEKLVLKIHYECLEQQKSPSVMIVHDALNKMHLN